MVSIGFYFWCSGATNGGCAFGVRKVDCPCVSRLGEKSHATANRRDCLCFVRGACFCAWWRCGPPRGHWRNRWLDTRTSCFLRPAARRRFRRQIEAEAQYVAAYGDMVESVAIARKINAQAVALEIQNSIDYVDAYFKRRELNRQWRAKENPNYLESEKHRKRCWNGE